MPKPSPIEQIMQQHQERIKSAHVAEQLARFVGSALNVLGEVEDDDRGLVIPLDEEAHGWSLHMYAQSSFINSTERDPNTPRRDHYSLNLWYGLGTTDCGDITTQLRIARSGEDKAWRVVGDEGAHDYDQTVSLTQVIVDGVKRYEQQNNITSPPDLKSKRVL